MRAYRALFSAGLRMALQYRQAALAGFTTQLFWGFIRVMVFDGFYRSSSMPQPLTFAQTVTYLWLIQALLLVLPWRIDPNLQEMIRSGHVSYELVRPCDLYWAWFARTLAGRWGSIALRALPMFVVAGCFLGLGAPSSWQAAAWFSISVFVATLLSCAILLLMTISLMWTLAGQGITRLMAALSTLLSGSILPLPLMPPWTQRIIAWLPFRGLMDTPFRLYMGDVPPAEAPLWVGQQVLWSIALILLGRWLLSRGLRRLEIQGG